MSKDKDKPATRTATTKKVQAPKKYRVTGFEAPLRVDFPGKPPVEFVEGQVFSATEWPQPHVTIPNQLAHGTIEEVE